MLSTGQPREPTITRRSRMRCPNCGQENPAEAKFCGKCATRLAAPVTPGHFGPDQSAAIGPGRASGSQARRDRRFDLHAAAGHHHGDHLHERSQPGKEGRRKNLVVRRDRRGQSSGASAGWPPGCFRICNDRAARLADEYAWRSVPLSRPRCGISADSSATSCRIDRRSSRVPSFRSASAAPGCTSVCSAASWSSP